MGYIAFVASLGGFLFGFDTAVISGAEGAIQEVFRSSDGWHGFTVAVAIFGTILGTLISWKPIELKGRRAILRLVALLYLISALGCSLIVDWYAFLFFRFLGGLAVGASSVVGPMYIAEISPASWRGRLVAFFQFNIVFGIVAAYLSNYLLSGLPEDWRWMLGVEAIPAFIFGLLLFTIPESPRWLIQTGSVHLARAVFRKIGEIEIDRKVLAISHSLETCKKEDNLFRKKYRKPLLYAFLIATFNQLSGINAILYYAPRIFEEAGIMRDSALMQSIIIGLTNLIFTLLAMLIIDKVGRVRLLIMGSIGMILALGLISFSYYSGSFSGYGLLVLLMLFIASFAISLGAVIWVLISEIFPNSVRARGQVFGSLTHWVWTSILSWIFPILVGGFAHGSALIFAFFTLAMLGNLIFALRYLPETKNKSLEELQVELINS